MEIEIRHRRTGKVLFASNGASSLKEAITAAVEKKFAARRYSSDGEFLGGSYETLNLSGADLRNADLSGAELGAASFWGADLSGADLSGAHVFITSFDYADLSNADLSGVELNYSSLEGANLRDATFTPGAVALQKHIIIAELLRSAAGEDAEKLSSVEQIPYFPYPDVKNRSSSSSQWGTVDWTGWEKKTYPLKAWALDILASYVVKVDGYVPKMLREHITRRSEDS